MFKQFLSFIFCASFITSPVFAMSTESALAQSWPDYLTSTQFGTHMSNTFEGAMFITFTAVMASMTILSLYATYKIITDDSSQKVEEPRPYQNNDIINLNVDIAL